MRRGLARWLAACALAVTIAGAGETEPSADEPLLLGASYPLEAAAPLSTALFHWVDSLAGTSGGKTIPAYRREYLDRFGALDERDTEALLAFRKAKTSHGRRAQGSALLAAFCETATVADALAAARPPLEPAESEAIRGALDRFLPRYRQIWADGEVPNAFLARAEKDPARRSLARLLARIAAFFDVDPVASPRPRIVVVPVPPGYGTHAEAVDRNLLIEVRPGEGLADEASVIVHENSHFLFHRIEEPRRRRLEAYAAEAGSHGISAWNVLREALPTALGQGMADLQFRPRAWSISSPWYHLEEVDRYAKSIYKLVNHSVASGKKLDEAFLREAIRLYPTAEEFGRVPMR
jgi:hypothetical protein